MIIIAILMMLMIPGNVYNYEPNDQYDKSIDDRIEEDEYNEEEDYDDTYKTEYADDQSSSSAFDDYDGQSSSYDYDDK